MSSRHIALLSECSEITCLGATGNCWHLFSKFAISPNSSWGLRLWGLHFSSHRMILRWPAHKCPDKNGMEGTMLVQCHAPLAMPFAAPWSWELRFCSSWKPTSYGSPQTQKLQQNCKLTILYGLPSGLWLIITNLTYLKICTNNLYSMKCANINN